MDELDAEVDLANNFLRAGNVARAEQICREVLQKRPDDEGAFSTLFDVHMEKGLLKAAYELCDLRLSRVPECPSGHLCKLVAYGQLTAEDMDYEYVRRAKGEAFMVKLRQRLRNHPLVLARAEILHGVYFQDTQEALSLVRAEREIGRLDLGWLDMIEATLGVHIGNTTRSREILVEQLAENPQDYQALDELSVVEYYRGRLFAAIKYARQARRLAPQKSALNKEVIIASTIGLIPVFWPAQIVITLTVFLSHRFEDCISTTLRWGGILAVVMIYGYIGSRLIEMGYGNSNLMILALILVGGWTYYVLFAFQQVGTYLSGRTKNIKLSKKY